MSIAPNDGFDVLGHHRCASACRKPCPRRNRPHGRARLLPSRQCAITHRKPSDRAALDNQPKSNGQPPAKPRQQGRTRPRGRANVPVSRQCANKCQKPFAGRRSAINGTVIRNRDQDRVCVGGTPDNGFWNAKALRRLGRSLALPWGGLRPVHAFCRCGHIGSASARCRFQTNVGGTPDNGFWNAKAQRRLGRSLALP